MLWAPRGRRCALAVVARERSQVAVHLLGARVQALGGLEQGSSGVEAPQLVKATPA